VQNFNGVWSHEKAIILRSSFNHVLYASFKNQITTFHFSTNWKHGYAGRCQLYYATFTCPTKVCSLQSEDYHWDDILIHESKQGEDGCCDIPGLLYTPLYWNNIFKNKSDSWNLLQKIKNTSRCFEERSFVWRVTGQLQSKLIAFTGIQKKISEVLKQIRQFVLNISKWTRIEMLMLHQDSSIIPTPDDVYARKAKWRIYWYIMLTCCESECTILYGTTKNMHATDISFSSAYMSCHY
jgi:hypothetical protein